MPLDMSDVSTALSEGSWHAVAAPLSTTMPPLESTIEMSAHGSGEMSKTGLHFQGSSSTAIVLL